MHAITSEPGALGPYRYAKVTERGKPPRVEWVNPPPRGTVYRTTGGIVVVQVAAPTQSQGCLLTEDANESEFLAYPWELQLIDEAA